MTELDELLKIAISVPVGYLFGSINPAILISRRMGTDIRTLGSGNAGSTNAYRNFGSKVAAGVLAGDCLKVIVAVLLMQLIFSGTDFAAGEVVRFAAGMGAVIGHAFPLYYGFRGGKGVVASAAMVLLFDWRMFFILIAVFLLFACPTRYVSLGSITAAAALPVSMCLLHWGHWYMIGQSVLVAALVIFLHRSNIRRLRAGTESKFFFKPKKKE